MAKPIIGLPPDFSLSVSKEDLTGPARLPDYLDSDPLLESLKSARRTTPPPPRAASPGPASDPAPQSIALEAQRREVIQRASAQLLSPAAPVYTAIEPAPSPPGSTQRSASPIAPSPQQSRPVIRSSTNPASDSPQERLAARRKPMPRRLQINLSVEAERKVLELLELLNSQSREKINISDLTQGLILSLYDARDEINVSRLPDRGRWGTPTARSFPTALGHALREAIVEFNTKQGANPFKKVVGE